jgi:hypothetical protein
MCDLKKALDFVNSCTSKDDDGRRYLNNIVFDKEKNAIVGTDGRRLAVLFIDPARVAGAANAPDRFCNVAFDESKQKFSVFPFAEKVEYPEYWTVIPGGVDRYHPSEFNATEEPDVLFNWENDTNGDYEREDLPGALCAELARRDMAFKPKYLKLPVFGKGTNNEWNVLGERDGYDSPAAFVNIYRYADVTFGIVYVVMPMRGDDAIKHYNDAKDILDNAFLNANVTEDRWRVVAGRDPVMLEKFLNVMFRKPGDPLFYLAESFRGATWYDVKTKVEKWARGDK